eukprot:TRINITY_DN46477_c0_g1_i1.p1 TRINITY_DN46477_c0_g1~~TRINITY_DN46477_c0_g1_i1.p1  ORF type:complete len:316 (-),score=29.64 TRINITY_DN46477_c0_g1_i1:15-962(-)
MTSKFVTTEEPASTGRSHKGVRFDLKAKTSDVQILAFSCSSVRGGETTVYSCDDTCSGNEFDSSKWTVLGKSILPKATCTELSVAPIQIRKDCTKGFYIYCTGHIYFAEQDKVLTENPHLQILPQHYCGGDSPFERPFGDNSIRVPACTITYSATPERGHCTGKLLWEDRVFCDLTITVATRSFSAHRAMLAAASPVFRRMLEVPMREKHEHRIEIDAPPEAVEAVLKYIYTGEEPTGLESLDVLPLAHRYELNNLTAACTSMLIWQFSPSNAQAIIQTLRPFKDSEPIKKAWNDMIALAEKDSRLVRPFIDCLA